MDIHVADFGLLKRIMTQNLLETGSFLAFEWLILIFDHFTYLCREFHSCVIVCFKIMGSPNSYS